MAVTLLQPLRSTGPLVQDADGNTIFIFDASLGEAHDTTGELTDHPVEDGSVVTDHFVKRPFELTITGLITNTPSDAQVEAVAIALAEAGIIDTRVRATYGVMLEVFEAGRPLTIDTGLRVYENMVLTAVSVPRGRPVQDIRPQLKFKQVTFAFSEVVEVPPDILAAAQSPSGQTETNGDQQGEKSEEDNEPIKSDAVRLGETIAEFTTGFSLD